MKRKLITVVLSAAVITGMTLSGCGNPAPAESPAEAQTETAAAAEEEAPAAEPVTLAAEGSSEPELHAEKYRNRSGSKAYLRGGFLAKE
jgi:hypothetical protein